MAVPFEEVLAKFTPEQRERIAARSALMIAAEKDRQATREVLSRARSLIAGELGVDADELDRLEADAERYLLALRKIVRSLGGTLDLVAEFPDGDPVRVVRLAELEVWPARRRKKRKAEDAKKA